MIATAVLLKFPNERLGCRIVTTEEETMEASFYSISSQQVWLNGC